MKHWISQPILWCLALTAAASSAATNEQVINVPGHADFLAVDGAAVWVTNTGRVERWSQKGKLAEVAVGKPCGTMAISHGSLWVADCKGAALNRIDLKTTKTIAVIPTGIANPKGELNVVAGAGSVWVASDGRGVVSRIDPSNNRVIASIEVAPGTFNLSFGFGSLWAVSPAGRSLQQIDPATNSVVKTTALGQNPTFLVAGEGAVWVQEHGDGTVARVDPETGEVTGRVKVGPDLRGGDIDAGGGKVWLRTRSDQVMVVIDPNTLEIRARLGEAAGSGALRYTPAGIWTTAHDQQTLSWWRNPESLGR